MSTIITVRDIQSDISVANGKLWEGECNFLKAIGSANSTIKIITWKIQLSWDGCFGMFPSSGYLNLPHSVCILSIKRSLCSRAASQLYKFKIALTCDTACIIYLHKIMVSFNFLSVCLRSFSTKQSNGKRYLQFE